MCQDVNRHPEIEPGQYRLVKDHITMIYKGILVFIAESPVTPIVPCIQLDILYLLEE